jgi:hypothetical protein
MGDPTFHETARRVLDDLFSRARDRDEFEYACTLLRIRGMEDAGWEPLVETGELVDDLLRLLDAPLLPKTQLRLALLLYCHITEVDAVYETIANMIRVVNGERYTFDPFGHLYRGKAEAPRYLKLPPSAKMVVRDLVEHATEAGESAVVELINGYFNDGVRNAFFHSDYILYENEFRTREASLTRLDGTFSGSMPTEEVEVFISRAVGVFVAFSDVRKTHVFSYRRDTEITGRMGGGDQYIPITLVADDRSGLYGFRG